ncbi:TPA: hypothetical protein NJ005_005167 [Vibrio parahaemolyticus]|nr:hypothetical protein [Vibrio parahaemolyticus]HCG5512105.1 hypothetical protein [Vibrio parahaemolyticus]
MNNQNFDHNKYKRLIEIATTQSGMRDILEKSEALIIKLSLAVECFISQHSHISTDKFLKVLSHAQLTEDQKGYFKVQAANSNAVQFCFCAYQQRMNAELDTLVVYICTHEEDEEFGILETHLQINADELANFDLNNLNS